MREPRGRGIADAENAGHAAKRRRTSRKGRQTSASLFLPAGSLPEDDNNENEGVYRHQNGCGGGDGAGDARVETISVKWCRRECAS